MKKLLYWQNLLLTRDKITLGIGFLVLTLAAIFPWYSLPQEALETFSINLYLTNIGRLLAALFVISGFAFTFRLIVNRVLRLTFWIGLIATLFFPYLIVTWSPTVAFIASSYYNQEEKVSNHVERNFSEVQAQWKQNISLNKPDNPPKIFEMSIQDSRFFQIPSWEQVLLNGFGYKNSLFVFIGKGWVFSLFGLVISLIGLYLVEEPSLNGENITYIVGTLKDVAPGFQPMGHFAKVEDNLNTFIQDVKLLLPGTALLLSTIFISIIAANILNYQLDTQFAKGEYFQVVTASQTLASWYPPLQGDVSFLERLAKAEFYTDAPEPALINFVMGLERYKLGNFQEAENYFQKSLDIQPSHFLVRGYLVSAILNQGVNYLNESNTRKPGAAADLFEKALQIFPGHVEALYDLMLARVVNGEFQKSADVAKQIIDGQQYFQAPSIGLLGQAYLHLAWAEYNNGDVNTTWERYRQSVDSKTWGKYPL
ncbi:tetratricopeptide repeat protein [Mastigocladopsis repens]|uniref:tetratricopeptide repeat protein n=1 Tax=Mastigocladopsis repens TaxID=221287 RepID=UPI0002F4C60F|nr:tetratricopeptide repeat protein [Mastigocladopsis repens]